MPQLFEPYPYAFRVDIIVSVADICTNGCLRTVLTPHDVAAAINDDLPTRVLSRPVAADDIEVSRPIAYVGYYDLRIYTDSDEDIPACLWIRFSSDGIRKTMVSFPEAIPASRYVK